MPEALSSPASAQKPAKTPRVPSPQKSSPQPPVALSAPMPSVPPQALPAPPIVEKKSAAPPAAETVQVLLVPPVSLTPPLAQQEWPTPPPEQNKAPAPPAAMTLEISPAPQVSLESPQPLPPQASSSPPAAHVPPKPPAKQAPQLSLAPPMPALPQPLPAGPSIPPPALELVAPQHGPLPQTPPPEPQVSLSLPKAPPTASPPKASAAPPVAQGKKAKAPTGKRVKVSQMSQALRSLPPPQQAALSVPSASTVSPAAPAAAAPITTSSGPSSSANVIVLSADRALNDLLRDSLAGMHRVWRADDVAHAGELIVTAGNPVFMIDVALVDGGTPELVNRVHEQFPDLAIILVGNREKEALLAPLESSGAVFGRLDKAAAAASICSMVDAAQRGQRPKIERRAVPRGKALSAAIVGIGASIKVPKVRLPSVRVDLASVRRWSGRCVRLVAIVLVAWALAHWKPWNYADRLIAGLALAPDAPAEIDNDTKLLKLLDDAGNALVQDRLVDPPGQNALELYRAALTLEPGNELALRGIDRVADKLLAEAEQALKARDMARLASAVDAARAARPDHPRLEYYSLQLKSARERRSGPAERMSR